MTSSARSNSPASRCIAERPNVATIAPMASTFGSSVKRLFLHLGRGLHHRDSRSDQRRYRQHRQRNQRPWSGGVAQQPVEGVHGSIVRAARYRLVAAEYPAGRQALAASIDDTIARVAGERFSV